jgi:hypothetical protein
VQQVRFLSFIEKRCTVSLTSKPYIFDAPCSNFSLAAPSPACLVTRVRGLANRRAVKTVASGRVTFRPSHCVLLFWDSFSCFPTPPHCPFLNHFIQCLKSFSLSRMNRKIFFCLSSAVHLPCQEMRSDTAES